MSDAVRVVIVDDHPLFVSGVRAEIEPDLDVVGTANGVDEAVEVIARERPEVVLLDVHMPGGGGRAVIEGALSAGCDSAFLAVSVSDEPRDVIEVIQAGARGYVTKTIDPAELVDAVRRIRDGDAVFSPRLAGFVLDAFRGDGAEADPDLGRLTPREREVLRLIARGFAYKECARRLDISPKTVEHHVSSVLRKLQLSSRHELSRWAADRRLI